KNTRVTVWSAEELREKGMSIFDAAVESARIRLRPILMTSFAFILGVMPLALGTGAGSAARTSVGTGVAGGMVASTFLSIIFIPVLYVVIRTIAPGRAHRDRWDDATSSSPGVATVGILLAIGLSIAAPAFAQTQAQTTPMETVTFDQEIARAVEKNPSDAIASTNILRSEALLQQARAQPLPRVGGTVTNSTPDS